MKNSSLRTIALVWAAVMIAVISSTVTLLVSGRASQGAGESARWVTQSEYDAIERYRRLDQVRAALMEEYYQPLDEDALLLGAIRGMTSAAGDPYTYYLTPDEMERSNEENAGTYCGIGTLVQRTSDGQIEVVQVYEDSPAEAAGLREGDLIVAVDGESVSAVDGRRYNDAVSRMRGEEGTQVTLTVLRDGQRLELPVTRGSVTVKYVHWQVIEGDIGYIRITQFSGNAADAFDEALAELGERGVKGLVVDVRNNPGGLLDLVVRIADRLLPTGVIVYVEEKDGTRQTYYSNEECVDLPLAVLVNGMSASASEILAASVQAADRGALVGINTYGKGIVQTLRPFPEDGSGLQLTTACYYDALDRCPHGVGVKPDIEVAQDGDSVPKEADPVSDNQLAAAVAEVRRRGEAG